MPYSRQDSISAKPISRGLGSILIIIAINRDRIKLQVKQETCGQNFQKLNEASKFLNTTKYVEISYNKDRMWAPNV